jgi:hypothetical protein
LWRTTKEGILADDKEGARALSVITGVLLLLFIGGGLFSAGGTTQDRDAAKTLGIEIVQTN